MVPGVARKSVEAVISITQAFPALFTAIPEPESMEEDSIGTAKEPRKAVVIATARQRKTCFRIVSPRKG